jgi:radical SAM protein with 4Fe4S-binding SPASM domain
MNRKKPRIIAFEVTPRCQFDCPHCRADAGPAENQRELTTTQCKKILKSIANFTTSPPPKKPPLIILTGGEPMQRTDIYKIIQHGRKLNLKMAMATCGYAIDDESINKLKKAGISILSFPIDSAGAHFHDTFRKSPGAFEEVVKAAKIAHRSGVPFQINTTITKRNADELVAIAELAKKLGARCFNVFILVPTGRAKQIADEVLDPVGYETLLHELLRLKLESKIQVRLTCAPQFTRICRQQKQEKLIGSINGCIGGRDFAFISYRGDVQACGFLNISAGNLIENGYDFEKIWTESEFLKELRDLSKYKGSCAICEYSAVCRGCRARAYATSGDYLAPDPICNYQIEGSK